MKNKCVVIKPGTGDKINGLFPQAEVIDFKNTLEFMYKSIECNTVQCVNRRIAGKMLDLWIDDEGKLVNKRPCLADPYSFVNPEKYYYPETIEGNVLILDHDEDGESIGFEEGEANRICEYFNSLSHVMKISKGEDSYFVGFHYQNSTDKELTTEMVYKNLYPELDKDDAEDKFIKNKKIYKDVFDLKLQDSLFYEQGDKIMDFEYKNYKVSIFVNGEKRIFNKDHTEHDWDLGKFGIETQEQLDKALENGDIDVCNNNWFEFSIVNKDTDEEITENWDTVLGDLNDALDINGYIDLIKAYEKQLEEETAIEL